MNSASQAALAALQMHSKPASLRAPVSHLRVNRSNSLSNYGRSNSMRTYTYTPKPSYQAGPPPQTRSYQSPPYQSGHSLRSNSLRSGSLRGAPRPQTYHQRQNSADLPSFAEDNAADNIVITTKTTKVVDSLGRTKSITTETIKSMPDGSNIIETKTTNISRPTSRSNSLRNNSLTHVSNANYNLDKIDEDLHDFDYTYLDHEDRLSPPRLAEVNHQQSPQTQMFIQEQRNALAPDFLLPVKPEERTASLSSTQSPKRLKSILKNGSNHIYQTSPIQDGREEVASIQDVIGQDGNGFSSNKTAAIDLPQQTSVASGASIKFRETVETISYPTESNNLAELLREEEFRKDQEKKKNIDMYSQAMKVAVANVYGKSGQDTSGFQTPPQSPLIEESKNNLDALAEKKLKKDQKRGKSESAGISKNYIYENHHRDFSMRSLRGGPAAEEVHVSTRKERAKEEKRLLKEEEKRNAELLKNAEKERKKEEKLQKKKEKKSFSLFGMKKRKDETANGLLMQEQELTSEAPIGLTAHENSAVSSPLSLQSPTYSSPREEAIVDSQGAAKLPENSSVGDRSSLFVDVPEIADEIEENTRVEVIEQQKVPSAPISRHSDVTNDPIVPPRGDIAKLQYEDPEVPPRADLQPLNSMDVHGEAIVAMKRSALVPEESKQPEVTINGDDFVNATNLVSLENPMPSIEPVTVEEPQRASGIAPVLVIEEVLNEMEHTPKRIEKPELQLLEEEPSASPLSDVLVEEVSITGKSSQPAEKSKDQISNEHLENLIELAVLRNLTTETHEVIEGGTAWSAASEESDRTLRSIRDPVVFKTTQEPPVIVHVDHEESAKTSAVAGDEQMESSGPETFPHMATAPLVTTTGKAIVQDDANQLERGEDPMGSDSKPAVKPKQESRLRSPIQLTLVSKTTSQQEPMPVVAETDSKKSPKKRTHRFKKMIDKYFINSYSR